MSGHELVHREARRCGAPTRKGTPCGRYAMRGRKRCKLHGGKSGRPPKHGARRRYDQAETDRTPTQRELMDARAQDLLGRTGPAARILVDVLDHYESCREKHTAGELTDEEWRAAARDYLDIVGRADVRDAEVRAKMTRAGLDDSLRLRIEAGNARVRDALLLGKEGAEERIAALPDDGWILPDG